MSFSVFLSGAREACLGIARLCLELILCTDGNRPDAITLEMCVDKRSWAGVKKIRVRGIQVLRACRIQASAPRSPYFRGKTHTHQDLLTKVNYVDFPVLFSFTFIQHNKYRGKQWQWRSKINFLLGNSRLATDLAHSDAYFTLVEHRLGKC